MPSVNIQCTSFSWNRRTTHSKRRSCTFNSKNICCSGWIWVQWYKSLKTPIQPMIFPSDNCHVPLTATNSGSVYIWTRCPRIVGRGDEDQKLREAFLSPLRRIPRTDTRTISIPSLPAPVRNQFASVDSIHYVEWSGVVASQNTNSSEMAQPSSTSWTS